MWHAKSRVTQHFLRIKVPEGGIHKATFQWVVTELIISTVV